MTLTDTQIRLAEQLLLSVINREPVVEYSELAARIDPPIFWRQVGREIGEVSKLCHELGLPLLSAKVVTKGQGKAGEGFYNLMKELGIKTAGESERELLSKELKKIRECTNWYILADYLGLNIDFEPRHKKLGHRPTPVSTQSQPTDELSAPTTWIFPSNNHDYNVIRAFQELLEIDWRQRVDLKIGDIIYIYCTKPYQRIMFKTVVTKLNIAHTDTIDDTAYWSNDFSAENYQYNFARLKLVKAFDTGLLSLSNLMAHGLKSAPQSALRAIDSLCTYIDNIVDNISSMYDITPLPEEFDDMKAKTYPEGSKKQITVNAYERNPLARNDCIRIHGSKCVICDFDFGAFYGDEFAGRIHVHHIKPIHTVNKEYEVDPEHDLAPACPNCHMILHLKPDGVYEIEEVKQMIAKKKRS